MRLPARRGPAWPARAARFESGGLAVRARQCGRERRGLARGSAVRNGGADFRRAWGSGERCGWPARFRGQLARHGPAGARAAEFESGGMDFRRGAELARRCGGGKRI
jgi:hypothetical protein